MGGPPYLARLTADALQRMSASKEELAEFDLPLAEVTRELFEKHRFAYIRLAGFALARAELDEESHMAAAWRNAEELKRFGVAFDETEGFIDLLGRIDLGVVAAALGGGGHQFMAGFTSPKTIPETLDEVRIAIAAAAR